MPTKLELTIWSKCPSIALKNVYSRKYSLLNLHRFKEDELNDREMM